LSGLRFETNVLWPYEINFRYSSSFNKFFYYKKEYVSVHLREHDDNL
jgi:hypothetical protein